MLLASYMSILFWFRKNVRAAHRPGTVQCRLTMAGEELNFATSVRAHKADWDSARQQLRGRSDAARLANHSLMQLADGLREAHNSLARQGRLITPRRVLAGYQSPQQPRESMLIVFSHYLNARRVQVANGQLSAATVAGEQVRLNRLEEWLADTKATDLRPDEFTVAKAEQFVEWLRARKRSKNYCLKIVQTFHTFLRWCQRHELLERHPLDGFAARFDPPAAPQYLTPADLVRLWFYDFESESLRRVADLFLFQCFTGLGWQDMANFRGSEHLRPRPDGAVLLRLERQKSGTTALVPFMRPALELLARYGGEQLPVPSNQFFNRSLKQIAWVLGLSGRLTTHVGRKTAGMILLQDGVPLTIVSKILGHASVAMTERHYTRVLGDTVMNEMSKIYGHQALGMEATVAPFLREFTERLLLTVA